MRKEIQNVIESNNFIQELNNISVFTGDENETRVTKFLKFDDVYVYLF